MLLAVVAVSWMAGLFLASHFGATPLSAALFLASAGLLATLLRGRGLALLPAVALAALSLGMLRAAWPADPGGPLPIQVYNGTGDIRVEGVVSSDPEPTGASWRFQLSVRRVQQQEQWSDSSGHMLVVAKVPPSLAGRDRPHFRYGDRLIVSGRAEEPPAFEDFDYRDYLARQGVFSTMVHPGVELVGEGEGNWLKRGILSLRNRLSGSLEAALPEPQNAMAQALLLGRRSAMPPELTRAFRDAGASHILAISGLHVGVLLGISVAFSRRLLGARRQLYLLLPLLSIWGYAALSGMSPSVQRAAVMGSVYLLGVALGRQNSVAPALAAAAAAMTGLQPSLLSDVSFQLSFAAMTGLALLAAPIERTLTGLRAGPGDEVRPAGALGSSIASTLAATIATLPLVAFHFQQVSLVGLPTTLLALPALPPILGAGLTTAVLGMASPPAAEVAGWAAWLLLSYLRLVVEVFDAIPGGAVAVGSFGAAMVVAYYGVLLGAIAALPRRAALRSLARPAVRADGLSERIEAWLPGRRVFLAMALLGVLASASVWTAAVSRPDGRLHVAFLDVGQGDAVFVVTPGGRRMLIDGGADPRRLLSHLGERVPFWDDSLDVVVLTHPHADHVAGLVQALERYDADLALERKVDFPSPDYALWRAALEGRDVDALQAVEGQRLVLDEGVTLEVVYPPEAMLTGTTSDVNNASVVMRLAYGETSFLLTGDIHWDVESYILRRGLPIRSDVLKVAHQGSRTSSLPAFVREAAPRVAVISVGADNQFGHPHPETLDTLGALLPPGRILTTARNGTVEFASDGSRLWMQTER